MSRALPLAVLALVLGACRTTARAAPPPQARWEVPLALTVDGLALVVAKLGPADVRLLVDTAASETVLFGRSGELQLGPERITAAAAEPRPGLQVDGVLAVHHLLTGGALVLDFPGQRLLALDGSENAWLRWLDERSPKGELAGVARLPPLAGGLLVQTRAGDGPEVTTVVATTALRSGYARSLFDAAVLEGVRQEGLEGVHLRIRDAEFGPLTVDVLPPGTTPPARLGLDVLKGLVVVVPVHDSPRIWFMTPRE